MKSKFVLFRLFRASGAFLIGSFLLSGALFSCFGGSEPGNPLATRLEGKDCDLWDDPSGVTHIRGSDELTALACMGYVHARDRAWQMDFLRRTAEGRTAEILGKNAIASDFGMRLMGLSEEARRLFSQMTPADRKAYWAYAYGVNRGLATQRAKDAYEFQKFGYQPESWSPASTLELILLESLDQTRKSFEIKLTETSWIENYGKEAPEIFSRDGLPWETTILKPGEYPAKSDPRSARLPEKASLDRYLAALRSMSRIFKAPVGMGSNNWVIAPQRSKTGHAWLANDPHLGLKYPSFWYWAHVEGGAIDVIGASLPGIPFITSGTNRHVAWGLTNSYMDVADLHDVPKEDLNGGTTHWPLIWVKFGGVQLPFFFKSFQRTRQGWPVLPLDSVPTGKALVLRWSGFDLGPGDFHGMFEIMTAATVHDADRAFIDAGVPSWNFVFADNRGEIGFRVNGKLPMRTEPVPFGVPEARLSDIAPWTFMTPEEAPHLIQPARGYIVTANNRHWAPDSILREGRAYTSSFRAFRIEELLKETPAHDLASIRKTQCDIQAVDARFLLPPMLRVLRSAANQDGGFKSREGAVYDLLSRWDYKADLACRACGVYSRWIDRILDDQDLNEEALYRLLSRDNPDEKLAASLAKAYTAALDDLKVGDDGQVRAWEDLHRGFFSHLSGDPGYSWGSIGTPGAENSVNPGTGPFDEAKGLFEHDEGASQRLVVEMTSPPEVYSILPGTEADLPDPRIGAHDGPWMRWERCDLERRAFPLNWDQVTKSQIEL